MGLRSVERALGEEEETPDKTAPKRLARKRRAPEPVEVTSDDEVVRDLKAKLEEQT